MTTIYLIRHGETLWNKEMKYQGHSNIELSSMGLQQAEMLAEALRDVKFDAVYASDLIRAVVTAKAFAAKSNLYVQQHPGFREISFGLWEGLTYAQIEKKWPGQMKALLEDASTASIPDGETFLIVRDRILRALDEVIAANEGKTIAIVSHGAAIRTILCATLDIPLKNLWKIRQDNTAINVIECFGEKRIVARVNDIHHLNAIGGALLADGTIHYNK